MADSNKSEIIKSRTLNAKAGKLVFDAARVGQLVTFRVGNKSLQALVSCPQEDRDRFIKESGYKGAYVVRKERYAGKLQYTAYPEGAIEFANAADEDDGF